jgi:hypothetical protein
MPRTYYFYNIQVTIVCELDNIEIFPLHRWFILSEQFYFQDLPTMCILIISMRKVYALAIATSIITSLSYSYTMSEFAFFRFKSMAMLTPEEEENKDEIIQITEEVLDAKGLECDSRISKISYEQLRDILDEVRKLRRKRRKMQDQDDEEQELVDNSNNKHEERETNTPYVK